MAVGIDAPKNRDGFIAVEFMQPSPASRIVIFSDFDGTITKVDVGDLMFDTFSDGSYEWPDEDWIAGRVSSKDCYLDQCACTRATTEELESFIDQQELDPDFVAFAEHCRSKGHPLCVLSDGMDYYIERLFRRHGLGHVPFFSNHLELHGEQFVPSFPYLEHSCGRCANCKGPHVERYTRPGDLVIYLGDGWSDLCGAERAHVIFAKGGLAKWCEQTGREHRPLIGFGDVLRYVERLDGDTSCVHNARSRT